MAVFLCHWHRRQHPNRTSILNDSVKCQATHITMTHRVLLTSVAAVRRQARRSFSSGPVTRFTEDEDMMRNAARQWANQELKPHVREMDNEAKLRPSILESLFACGFMGMVRV